MNGISDVLIAVAAVALVVVRQMRARQVRTGRRIWLLPLILAVVALRDPQLIDPGHRAAAVALLAAGVLVEVAMGCVWGWTTRIWQAEDGTLWVRGTKATAAAWAGMLVLRGGLYALGAGMGVHQGTNGLLLAVAALLLVRGLVVAWRAHLLEPSYRVPAAG
ncbi:DUF1453 domain-containing protein [Streptomyces sp. NPDC092296]|uniref:DUF1453 domain-containing protein n=1 Tax=Streptomyces sp. NPDC092296 TaxID=3366012 RepID=UPI003819C118